MNKMGLAAIAYQASRKPEPGKFGNPGKYNTFSYS